MRDRDGEAVEHVDKIVGTVLGSTRTPSLVPEIMDRVSVAV